MADIYQKVEELIAKSTIDFIEHPIKGRNSVARICLITLPSEYTAVGAPSFGYDGDIPAIGKQTTYESAKKALLDHVVFTELNKGLLL